jgi:hypothetical protein
MCHQARMFPKISSSTAELGDAWPAQLTITPYTTARDAARMASHFLCPGRPMPHSTTPNVVATSLICPSRSRGGGVSVVMRAVSSATDLGRFRRWLQSFSKLISEVEVL